jgi:hypothetical protein
MTDAILNGIGWELLRGQKLSLYKLSEDDRITGPEREVLIGVINLLDSIQDTAVDTGYKTTIEVFGEDYVCPQCGSNDIEPSWCAHGYMQCETCGCEWLDEERSTKIIVGE